MKVNYKTIGVAVLVAIIVVCIAGFTFATNMASDEVQYKDEMHKTVGSFLNEQV